MKNRNTVTTWKTSRNSLKAGVIFWVAFVITALVWTTVAAIKPTWVDPQTMEATTGTKLASQDWNGILGNLSYLKATLNTKADKTYVDTAIANISGWGGWGSTWWANSDYCNGYRRKIPDQALDGYLYKDTKLGTWTYDRSWANYVWSTVPICNDIWTNWDLPTLNQLISLFKSWCVGDIINLDAWTIRFWTKPDDDVKDKNNDVNTSKYDVHAGRHGVWYTTSSQTTTTNNSTGNQKNPVVLHNYVDANITSFISKIGTNESIFSSVICISN